MARQVNGKQIAEITVIDPEPLITKLTYPYWLI